MSAREITRRDALKMGGMAIVGAAGSTVLGGCASSTSASSSTGSSSSTASSTAGDRTNVPADTTGADIKSQSSIALVDDGASVEIQHLPEIAADMLAANPNLYTDISWVVYDYYVKDNFPDNYKDGNTMDDWVALCEEYPDRIMVGTDKVGHWKTYPAEVVKYYDLLDKLNPETAKKICHDNILGLVKRY